MSENSIWSLRGVSPEARASVKACAEAEGVSIGAWISDAIRELHAREQNQAAKLAQGIQNPLPELARKSSIERTMMRAAAGNA
jgi:hypothetical protein